MVTLDRGKLAAPVAAQAAAFAVVLVIGIFHGHSTTPGPAHSAKLTVTVTEEISGGLTVAGSQVKVLRGGTNVVIASGNLNTARVYATNLPSGAYEVCVNPAGWSSAVPGTQLIRGFICSPVTVASAPQSVTFRVVPKTTQAAA